MSSNLPCIIVFSTTTVIDLSLETFIKMLLHELSQQANNSNTARRREIIKPSGVQARLLDFHAVLKLRRRQRANSNRERRQGTSCLLPGRVSNGINQEAGTQNTGCL